MVKLFGTDGIRGLVNEDIMSPEMGMKLGRAMVLYCQKRKWPLKIIIGKDTRESGTILEDAIASGAMSMGADVVLAGIIPTPGLSYLVQEQKAGMGLVVSASHNHFGYNGLKPFNQNGTKLTDQEEIEIEKYILENNFLKKIGKEFVPGKKNILIDAKDRYANFILDKLPSNLKMGGKKIILDCANGATFEVAPFIFEKIIGNINSLFIQPDGKNINDNCGSQHTQSLKDAVTKNGADLGLAFDGDGDRLIAVSEKGDELTGDQIIYIIAKMFHEKGELNNNAVVTTVMSNVGFISSLKKLGISHFSTNVGDRPVYFEMQKRGAILGGEEAGHIIISNIHPTGDGIVAGLMLISVVNYFKKPLSQIAGEVVLFPKILVNVEVKRKPDLSEIPEIGNAIREVEKSLGDFGRVLVRYSGTENLCRVMVEGKDKKEITDYADKIAKVVKILLN